MSFCPEQGSLVLVCLPPQQLFLPHPLDPGQTGCFGVLPPPQPPPVAAAPAQAPPSPLSETPSSVTSITCADEKHPFVTSITLAGARIFLGTSSHFFASFSITSPTTLMVCFFSSQCASQRPLVSPILNIYKCLPSVTSCCRSSCSEAKHVPTHQTLPLYEDQG